MKTEFLKAMGLTEEQIADVMKENGKDVEAAKAKYADYEDLKTRLTDADKAIEGFKAMDIDGIQKAAADWKQKAEQAEKDAAAKVAEMQFSGLLDTAITAAKGRNAKAIRALLDMDALQGSKNQSEDVKTAIEALKKENGYLFDDVSTPPPFAAGTGTAKVGGMTKEAFAKLGYRERLELKQNDPKTYEEMKE